MPPRIARAAAGRVKGANQLTPPKNWEGVYKGIERMRSVGGAPVDTVGCDMLADEKAPPATHRFQSLVALMLSSQTKDASTAEAMRKLRQHGLTVDTMIKAPESKIKDLIYGVGFFNNKAKYIKATAQRLRDEYNGDTPRTVEECCKLPGVGPKMAHLFVQVAFGKVEGIGVDVHVHRISNRLKWVKSSTPEETRVGLEAWLPKEYWRPINKLFVGFGQTICTPLNPKCDVCTINKLCPSAFREGKSQRAGSKALPDLEDLASEKPQGGQKRTRGAASGKGAQPAKKAKASSTPPSPPPAKRARKT